MSEVCPARSSQLLIGLLLKVGVRLLATLKPLKRQGWQKVGFILEAGNLGRRADACPKANRGARAFIDGGRDYTQKQCGQL